MGKGRVIGIGGIFFRSNDPAATKDWYSKHLGMITDQWGAPFEFRLVDKPEVKGLLQWSPCAADTDIFGDPEQQYMINYRVEYIEDLIEQLKSSGVTICDEIATYEYGKFVHILDHAGIKVELWEPVDKVFDEMYAGKTNK